MPTPPDELPHTVLTDTSPHVARIGNVIRAIWERIPKDDQLLMLKAIATYLDERLVVAIQDDWNHSFRTNAVIDTDHGLIRIDGGYVNAADDRHISSTLAHELGHLRGYADPSGPDLSEETADHFEREVWGFPQGEVVFKCQVCRCMETILNKEGIAGQILWCPEWFSFVYLPPSALLELRKSTYVLLDDHPWTSAEAMLLGEVDIEDSLAEERKQKARTFKKTKRYKRLRESLSMMADYMTDDQDPTDD